MCRFLLLFVDLVLLLSATACALFLRENFQVSVNRLIETLPYFFATAGAGLAVLSMVGVNRTMWRFSNLQDNLRVTGAVIATAACASILAFAYNRLDGVARSLPFLQVITATAFLTGARVLHRLAQEHRRHRKASAVLLRPATGEALQTILIVGLSRLTEIYLQAAAELAPGHIRIAGLIGRAERHAGRIAAAHPVLGVPEDIEDILTPSRFMGSTWIALWWQPPLSLSRLEYTKRYASRRPHATSS